MGKSYKSLQEKLDAGICPSCGHVGVKCRNTPGQLTWKCEQCGVEEIVQFNRCETCGEISEDVTKLYSHDAALYDADYMCGHCFDWHQEDEQENMMRD